MYNRLAIFSFVSILTCFSLPSNAETCQPLNLVGGNGTSVTKTVSQPTIPGPLGIKVTQDNWNTDWAVPGNTDFNAFKAEIISKNGSSFSVKMYLKYSDQTSDNFFDQDSVNLKPNEPLIIEATPREKDQPYQINLFVGGLNHVGNNYQASVMGCL